MRRYAAEANRDPDVLMAGVVLPAHVDSDGERARRHTQDHLSARYGQPFKPRHVERYCLAGTAEESQNRVAAYAAAGVRHIVFNPAGRKEEFLDECETLYRHVVAPMRASLASQTSGSQ